MANDYPMSEAGLSLDVQGQNLSFCNYNTKEYDREWVVQEESFERMGL